MKKWKIFSFFLLLCFFYRFGVGAESSPEKTELVKPNVEGANNASIPKDSKPAEPMTQTATSGTTDKLVRLATPITDAQTEKILNSLAKQAGWFPELTITVIDGMVTIKGRAKDTVHLEWLAKTADRLPNVIAVINQAEVETPAASDFTPVVTEARAMLEKSKKALPRIAVAILILVLFYFINRKFSNVVYSLWGRSISNLFLHSTVAKLTMLPVWLLMFYLVLQVAGLQSLATTIIGGTGAVGLILGFAFKDIMSNYLSGILLAIRSPFTKGDDIQIGDYAGFIQNLNMRGTTIIDADGNLILIPNATVTQSVIINKSITKKKRALFYVGVSYRDSSAHAIEVIESVLQQFPDILKDPKPLVITEKFSDTMMNIKTTFWFDDSKTSGDKIKSNALEKIRKLLLAEEFTLPGSIQQLVITKNTDKTDLRNNASGLKDLGLERGKDHSADHDEEVKRLGQGLDIMRKSGPTTEV